MLDQTRDVLVWDTATGQPAARLAATIDVHKDSVLHAAFSPDGKWLATASKDYTARLWPVSAFAAGPARTLGE